MALFCTIELKPSKLQPSESQRKFPYLDKKTPAVVFDGSEGESVVWNSHSVIKAEGAIEEVLLRVWGQRELAPGVTATPKTQHAGFASIPFQQIVNQVGREFWVDLQTLDGLKIMTDAGQVMSVSLTIEICS
mmetsp:Transcript_10393/g.16239  ORF Transcript_10393/g.16239 Transcript_10393/m.16239 type:complete len:132 (+) Transcript_10393:26-421(+)